MRAAILGCGPAGLMAAHAAVQAGHDIDIFSKRRKSEMYGSQWLHAPIPGMTDVAPVEVKYQLVGSTEDYRRKVYGDSWEGQVSPEDYAGDHEAWDIRRTYDNLWRSYADCIINVEVDQLWLRAAISSPTYDVIISSIPKAAICRGVHQFSEKPIWAMGDAPERGTFVEPVINDNTVICNGELDTPWYRLSRVFGYSTIEWPVGSLPAGMDMRGATFVYKPLDNNCDCWPDVLCVGRYGQWQKDVLSHTAYEDVMRLLVVGST